VKGIPSTEQNHSQFISKQQNTLQTLIPNVTADRYIFPLTVLLLQSWKVCIVVIFKLPSEQHEL